MRNITYIGMNKPNNGDCGNLHNNSKVELGGAFPFSGHMHCHLDCFLSLAVSRSESFGD